MIKSTITLQKKIICTCDAYPYPHAVGQGKCKESLLSAPSFSPPKRGLASKLCTFIDALESEINDLSDPGTDSIANLIKSFKQEIYGDREASNF